MSRVPARTAWLDRGIALALAAGYVGLLLATAGDLGYARDEGFYFQAAKSYAAWFDLLWDDSAAAMEQAAVDRYWRINHEHPALIKSLFALSWKWFHVKLGWFAEAGTAFRFPGMLLSGLAVAITYAWGARMRGRFAGLMAALLLAFMPRVFYHSHLDCFDMPVAAMWLVTTYAFWRSTEGGGLRWAIATGLLYGLLLNTKHNSWLLPGALLVHAIVARGPGLWRELKAGVFGAPAALVCMATIGPVVFYLTWPWIWFDTGARLADYVQFHTGHEYYNMEFLGRTYWKPPMPRGYAWLMTLASVPAITLVLAGAGFASGLRGGWGDVVRRWWRWSGGKRDDGDDAVPRAALERPRTELLWLLCILLSYAPWWSTNTPIFGGTKHWITAYPFLALFAGVAAAGVLALLVERLRERVSARWAPPALAGVLGAAIAAAPVTESLDAHPWGLGAYTPLVGGAPGAASLGLNRSFWGYTTGSAAPFLNERAATGARVFVHDTALQSWGMMAEDGRLRRDLRPTLDIAGSDIAIYHHEGHMSRVEYQVWVAYGTTEPVWVGTYDGVPVVWVYARPGKLKPVGASEQ